jgi:uncharacterized FlgJ-related protein
MAQVKPKIRQEHYEEIDHIILENYMARITENNVKLLEEHTNLINRMYEHGLADFNEAIHLQHINKRLSKKLRIAHRAKPNSLVQQAIALAIKEKCAG